MTTNVQRTRIRQIERRTEPRRRSSHISSTGRRREMSGVANDPPDTTGAGSDRGGKNRPQEATETPRQPKRKNESSSRNQRRTKKLVQYAERGLSPAQRELHLLLGGDDSGVHSQAPGGSQQVPYGGTGATGSHAQTSRWRPAQWKMTKTRCCGGDKEKDSVENAKDATA